MQAVILAGGRGERLRPITDTIPKSLIPIKGKPFLEHQLLSLVRNNIYNFVLCIGYLAGKVQDHFNAHPIPGANIQFSVESEPLGTGGSLKNAGPLIRDEFLLINGDTFSRVNYSDLVKYFHGYYNPVVMTAYDNHDHIAENNISVNPNYLVTAYNRTSPAGMNRIDSGILAVKKKDFFEAMPDKRIFSFEEEVYPILIEQQKIRAYPTSTRFYDIGTPEILMKIEQVL
jgi:NDP-sugar pyrophosphorylase family protein